MRTLEVSTALRAKTATSDTAALPLLTAAQSTESGYTAVEDVGIREWRAEHPTFDGRGVTIALLETGTIEFEHPAFGPALTLDGKPVSKLAGIINALDPADMDGQVKYL